ncbi:hypothetical protein D3C76_1614280 [compost metagenome]
MQPGGAVVFDILAGVDNVKTCSPAGHRQIKHNRDPINPAGYRHPSAQRRKGNGQTEYDVAQPGKPFGIRIKDQEKHRDGKQFDA